MNKLGKTIHFVLESQEKVGENEFRRVVGTWYSLHREMARLSCPGWSVTYWDSYSLANPFKY